MIKPYYDKGGITIYNADCREVLPFLGEFDLCLTDPPYGCYQKQEARQLAEAEEMVSANGISLQMEAFLHTFAQLQIAK